MSCLTYQTWCKKEGLLPLMCKMGEIIERWMSERKREGGMELGMTRVHNECDGPSQGYQSKKLRAA